VANRDRIFLWEPYALGAGAPVSTWTTGPEHKIAMVPPHTRIEEVKLKTRIAYLDMTFPDYCSSGTDDE
jgi:hypothetical protein